jgi:hypothetical protein
VIEAAGGSRWLDAERANGIADLSEGGTPPGEDALVVADALGDGEGMCGGDGAVVDLEGHVRTVEESAQRGNGGRGLFELSFEAFKVRADHAPPAFGIGRGEDGSDLVNGHAQRPQATDDLCRADLRDGIVPTLWRDRWRRVRGGRRRGNGEAS